MPGNLDILQIMIDGGERLCDDALAMWYSGQYSDMDDEIRSERLRWWSDARRMVREFAAEIREWQKAQS